MRGKEMIAEKLGLSLVLRASFLSIQRRIRDFTPTHIHRCNLRLYTKAAAVAKEEHVDLLVLPEGYGLSSKPNKENGYFEPYDPNRLINNTPCLDINASFVTKSLSCLASNYSIGLATNVFTELLSNGTRRITEIIFDSNGKVIANYDKHHLFPISEPSIFQPGPYNPTSISYLDTRFGLAICYEGFYPYVTRDFSQFESLKAMNVTTLLWSVGGSAISSALDEDAKWLSSRFEMNVFASEDSEILKTPSVALYDTSGHTLKYSDSVVLDGDDIGYTANAFVRFANVSS